MVQILSTFLKILNRFNGNNNYFYSNGMRCFLNNICYEVVEPIYPKANIKRSFPTNIAKPNYALNGCPNKHMNVDFVKNIDDIKRIWNSCKIAKNILMTTGKRLKVFNSLFLIKFFNLF